jgi:hypothetical protein
MGHNCLRKTTIAVLGYNQGILFSVASEEPQAFQIPNQVVVI